MINALKTGHLRQLAKYEDLYISTTDLDDVLTKTREQVLFNYYSSNHNKSENCNNHEQKPFIKKKKSADSPTITDKNANNSDIRYIVKEGIEENKTAYEVLKKSGYIKSSDNDVFKDDYK